MNKILELLDKILILSQKYETKLSEFESEFRTNLMSSEKYMSSENQIKEQSYAFGLLKSYISNQMESIRQFKTNWTIEQKINYLLNFNSHGLTNGKFYDYAVGHLMWKEKQPIIYNLIEDKIREYCELERKLKFNFRKYVSQNYDSTIWHFPTKLIEIFREELNSGNHIIESSADEYFDYKVFFKFKYEFSNDYRNRLTNFSYRKLNDIKYWNEEYQDYYMVVASGFEKK